MQDKNSNSTDSIEALLDEISVDKENIPVSDGEKTVGLDFSFGEEEEPEAKVLVEFETVEQEPKVPQLSVPDRFTAGPKYNSAPDFEKASAPTVTYVPRFTGVSEKYRMSDQPRITADSEKIKRIKESYATAEYKEDMDPTAEIEQTEKETVIEIKQGNAVNNDELESSSKVFKFESDAPLDTEKTETPELVQPVRQVEIDTEPQQIEEESTEKAEQTLEHMIPDPAELPTQIENTVSASITANSVLEESPRNLGAYKASGKWVKEYTSFAQRDSIKDRFIDTVMSIYVRFFAALILAVIVAVAEFSFAMGADIPSALGLSVIPGAMALLDFQFVLCLYLLALPETVVAVKNLICKRLTPELYLTVAFLVSILFTVVITLNAPARYALFGLPFAIFAISTIAASFFKTSADFSAFKRATRNGEKTVIDNAYTRNLEHENSALDGAVEEHKSKTARTFRALFVSDFFNRSSVCRENVFNFLVILGVSLGTAIVVGLIALFIPGGWVNAISAFTLVFMLACPTASILVRKIPYFHASREAEIEKSSIVGEGALVDYAGVDVITFEDTEVFGEEDVTLQRIMLYGNSENLTKALRQSSAVFMSVGGPLNVLFSNSLDRKCSPAGSVCVEKLGVSGAVDGRTVLVGSLDYMLEKGAKIPAEEIPGREKTNNSTKVIFVAEDGAVYAKFYIRYSFSEEFTMLLPILEDAKIMPLVYTRDFNITSELISVLTAGANKIRIMRKYDTRGGEVIYRRVSAGIVTYGDKSNVINMILLSKKHEKLHSYLRLGELICMSLGVAFATVMAIAGTASVPSLIFAGFQILCCGVLCVASAISLRFLRRKK